MFDILQKYNFWSQSKAIPTGFLRTHYLDTIKHYINTPLIKVLMGQRRAGKSYLLRQIIQHLIETGIHPHNIFYLNKEIHDFSFIQTSHDLKQLIDIYKETLNPQGKKYIFLDEVQDIAAWEKLVNSLSQDYVEAYEVFISGSNSNMLSSELATHISGRYVPFEIMPFQFTEYCQFWGKDIVKTSFMDYLQSGGLPELFGLSNLEVKQHYVQSLRDTILLKDIVSRYQIKQAKLLEHIFMYLVDNMGSLFSYQSLVRCLKAQGVSTNVETLSNYLHYLEQCYLIHGVARYDVKGKRFIEGNKKYYLNDMAFKNYLASGFDPSLGHKLENLVYLHYRQQGYNIYVGTLYNKEIDFVLEKSNDKKYVQVAYLLSDEMIINREFGNLAAINDHYEKLVISLDDVSFGEKEGIKHICAWQMVLTHLPGARR